MDRQGKLYQFFALLINNFIVHREEVDRMDFFFEKVTLDDYYRSNEACSPGPCTVECDK